MKRSVSGGRPGHKMTGVELRAIRASLGISQKAFAVMTNVGVRKLQTYEKEREIPGYYARLVLNLEARLLGPVR